MSASSDVYITKEEARKRVKSILLHEQEQLVDKAIEAMDRWDLSRILNADGDGYSYYNIEN